MNPFVKYVLPSVVLGATFGYLAKGLTAEPGEKKAGMTPRAAFLSSDDDEFDYEKLARACLGAADRGARPGHRPAVATSNAEVDAAKGQLDRVMSVSLESGVWSRGAAFRADNFLRQLPASDASDFERLVRTAVDRGDLTLQDGAWLPGETND